MAGCPLRVSAHLLSLSSGCRRRGNSNCVTCRPKLYPLSALFVFFCTFRWLYCTYLSVSFGRPGKFSVSCWTHQATCIFKDSRWGARWGSSVAVSAEALRTVEDLGPGVIWRRGSAPQPPDPWPWNWPSYFFELENSQIFQKWCLAGARSPGLAGTDYRYLLSDTVTPLVAAAHRIFGRSRRGRGSARAFHYTSDSTRSFTKERSRNWRY